jgi:imidazolonepropionase-like amidohydrolase
VDRRFRIAFALAAALGAVAAFTPFTRAQRTQPFDIVIANGRVIDPASGLDAIRHVGIRGGRIEAVSAEALQGSTNIDASTLVVAPGFIDLHQHGRLAINEVNYAFKVMDGVTTALELEIGTSDVDAWYASRRGRSLVNHGVSAGHVPVRMAVMGDQGDFVPNGPAMSRAASADELPRIVRGVEDGMRKGALAVGFGLAYTPAASRAELIELFRIAARYRASAHAHVRDGAEGVRDAVSLAAETAASLHVVHAQTPELLREVREGRARGVDVTTEMYPYTASATMIDSALYRDWEKFTDAQFQTLLWPATGERLTRETFAKYRATGGMVIRFGNTEENVRSGLADQMTMIASDGNNTPGEPVHPRTAGTFARTLGVYVRDQQALSLPDGIRKMTVMPAMRLERRLPEMVRKGRISVGADADITVFDPRTIADRSTYEKPAQYSTGVRHVVVNGVPVVRNGQLLPGMFPGRPLRAPMQ